MGKAQPQYVVAEVRLGERAECLLNVIYHRVEGARVDCPHTSYKTIKLMADEALTISGKSGCSTRRYGARATATRFSATSMKVESSSSSPLSPRRGGRR
jgi:hypothetical protein